MKYLKFFSVVSVFALSMGANATVPIQPTTMLEFDLSCQSMLAPADLVLNLALFKINPLTVIGATDPHRIEAVHATLRTLRSNDSWTDNEIALAEIFQDEGTATFQSGHLYPNDPDETYTIVVQKDRVGLPTKVFTDTGSNYFCFLNP